MILKAVNCKNKKTIHYVFQARFYYILIYIHILEGCLYIHMDKRMSTLIYHLFSHISSGPKEFKAAYKDACTYTSYTLLIHTYIYIHLMHMKKQF